MTISISPSIPQIKQPLVFTAVMSALTFGMIGMQSSKLSSLRAVDKSLDPAVLKQDTKLRSSRLQLMKAIPKFGFNNVVSNTAFVDFLGYFGNEDARNVAGYELGFDYFDVILQQDPRFFLAYYFLSGTGSGYMGNPARSVSIMNEGFKYISPHSPKYSFYLWRLKATNEPLFIGDTESARASMQNAADWAKQIGDEESRRVADTSQKSADYLARNPASKQARFSAWAGILDTAIDNHARKLAVAKIRELGGKVELDANGKIKLTPPAKD